MSKKLFPRAGIGIEDVERFLPLDNLEAEWVAVPEASFLTITRGKISCEAFAPIAP